MGGSSPSSSSSQNTTTTEQFDERVAVGQDGIAIGGRANVNVDATDPLAFELTGDLLKVFQKVGGDVVSGSFDLANQATDMVRVNNDMLAKFAEQQAQKVDGSNTTQTLIKIGLPLGAAVLALKGLDA